MKFHSPTDQPIHLGLTSGHTCVIPPPTDENPEGAEVEARFVRQAIAAGAVPAGMPTMPAEENLTPTRSKVIKDALMAMVDGNEAGDFKKDGTPDLNALTHRVGFKVSREECAKLWAELKAEA